MEGTIICNVCSEEFSSEGGHIPRILTACGHSFCETCLRKLENKKSVRKPTYAYVGNSKYRKEDKSENQYAIKCPTCKRETISDFSSDSLPKNYSFLDLITEVVENRKDQFCQVHPNYILDMFCHDEEETICMKCSTYGKHKTHKVSKLSWFSDQQGDSIQHKINCADDVICHYEDLRSDLESRKDNLEHKVKYIQNAITSRFSQIQSEINTILDTKQDLILSQLEKCSSSQICLLEMQEEAASNFIDKLEEKRNYADTFLAEADESSIAKEKNLHSEMLECINEAQNHKMLTNNMYKVQMDKSDHIVESVKEMIDDWVCSVEESDLEPSLESTSTIWEKKTPSFAESLNVMFGEASEVVVNDPFERIDCKFLCDGELQDCVANCDEKTDCDLKSECDTDIESECGFGIASD